MCIDVYNIYVFIGRLSSLSNIRFYSFIFIALAILFFYFWDNLD